LGGKAEKKRQGEKDAGRGPKRKERKEGRRVVMTYTGGKSTRRSGLFLRRPLSRGLGRGAVILSKEKRT